MFINKAINFNTHRFAVVGLGDTGLSIIDYLKFKQANIVKVLDTRDNPPNQEKILNLPFIFGKLKPEFFDAVDVIVISPGISIYEQVLQYAITKGILVLGDIELFAQEIKHWSSKIIGVTGSNGKTTVTTLTGYLAKSIGIDTLVAGNIGIPVLRSFIDIETNKKYPQLIVLELSSFQLESIYSLSLDSATVLNISEDHLDRYRDLLEYAYVKANIFNNCKVQVLNSDDVLSLAMKRSELKLLEISGENSNANFSMLRESNQLYIMVKHKKFLPCKMLNLVGTHNYINVLASLALLEAVGVDIYNAKLISSLKAFSGLEHRMQKIAQSSNQITFIEDSKGTNVGSVVAGISGLDAPVNLILGGDGKGQDFMPLRNLVQNKCKSVA
ncbi:MAG: UDP-N-acetylmuramoyl-L-alanine--D-glutamate ligase, partial [Burkholderiales bacterium]|nr:UDP-N-acetylmuramoyl-L-alanine--D-glutamate ligase [Burkholderiales bacterium]